MSGLREQNTFLYSINASIPYKVSQNQMSLYCMSDQGLHYVHKYNHSKLSLTRECQAEPSVETG